MTPDTPASFGAQLRALREAAATPRKSWRRLRAALKGDDAWAARIMGAGDAVTERTGATVFIKPAPALKEQAEREVRSRLGRERWARAYAAGRSASIDSLLNDIERARG